MVEHDLAKVGVAGSSPVFRSKKVQTIVFGFFVYTLVAEQVDAQDLKSCSPKGEYGFDSRLGYQLEINFPAYQWIAGYTWEGLLRFFFFTNYLISVHVACAAAYVIPVLVCHFFEFFMLFVGC